MLAKIKTAALAVKDFVMHVEPAAVGGFFTAVVALVVAVKAHSVTAGVVTAVVAAAQGLLVRQAVTPVK